MFSRAPSNTAIPAKLASVTPSRPTTGSKQQPALAETPTSEAGSPCGATPLHGLSPSDCGSPIAQKTPTSTAPHRTSPDTTGYSRVGSATQPQQQQLPPLLGRTADVNVQLRKTGSSNTTSTMASTQVATATADYRPGQYPPMPVGFESPSVLPSLLPLRQLNCPPPSRSLQEQTRNVRGGSLEGRLCRNIILDGVEVRSCYLVGCTIVNCVSKGCYFTSCRIQSSDLVNAPCVISCALNDSFVSLSILSNCKMTQGALKESRAMDCDVEAAGVFFCRITRSTFYRCEYKEIEQVDCDLTECDGNGDVDTFFPTMVPKRDVTPQGVNLENINNGVNTSSRRGSLNSANAPTGNKNAKGTTNIDSEPDNREGKEMLARAESKPSFGRNVSALNTTMLHATDANNAQPRKPTAQSPVRPVFQRSRENSEAKGALPPFVNGSSVTPTAPVHGVTTPTSLAPLHRAGTATNDGKGYNNTRTNRRGTLFTQE